MIHISVATICSILMTGFHSSLSWASLEPTDQVQELDPVDYEIKILTPDEAIGVMKSEGLTDETLEVQAANGPFQLFGDFFGSNQNADMRTAHPRRTRRHKTRASGSCEARSGMASYYGSELAGNKTASGSVFHPGAMTAAHRTLRFGSLVRVSYGRRSTVVTINDRGPFIPGRVIDLSAAAARFLGLSTGFVSLQVLRCG